ncbi:hypothetical protein KI387_017276, partial [Taxus chinensis]
HHKILDKKQREQGPPMVRNILSYEALLHTLQDELMKSDQALNICVAPEAELMIR